MTNLFDQNNTNNLIDIDPNKDYSSELIGEGKKYKTAQDAARALLEKDNFIERLKAEKSGVLEDLQKAKKIEELLDKINRSTQPVTNAPVIQNTDTVVQTPNNALTIAAKTLSEADIVMLMEQREKKQREDENLQFVAKQVQGVFGANYQFELAKKARDLGVSESFLTDVAKSNPNAFLKLVEADKVTKVSGSARLPQGSSTNISSTSNSTMKFKDYEKIRKENSTLYWSNKVQNEMFNRLRELGDEFYN